MASKEDIISYVMKTPENTNPNVLGNMLDDISGDSIDFGTMDFTRNGNRYVVLDYHANVGQSPFFTLNTETTSNEIADFFGYKRLYTTDEIRSAIDNLYDFSNGSYIGKMNASVGVIEAKATNPYTAYAEVNRNDNGDIVFRYSDSDSTIVLQADNTWISSHD